MDENDPYRPAYNEEEGRFENPTEQAAYEQFQQELAARLAADAARYPADALEAVEEWREAQNPANDPMAERVYNLDEQRFEDEDPPAGMVYNLDTGQWEPE